MDTIFYKMKWSFLVISFSCALIACAQPKIIIHGYSQQFTPGTIPTRDVVGENADMHKTSSRYYQLFDLC
jgi:hypothetical protein